MRALKELHPYILVTVLTNIIVNPVTYWNIYVGIINALDYFPVVPATLLLAGIVLAIVKRDFKAFAPEIAINAAMMVWGVVSIYPLFTDMLVPTI